MNIFPKILALLFIAFLVNACSMTPPVVVEEEEPLVDPEGDDVYENARGLFDYEISDNLDPGVGDTTDILYWTVETVGTVTVFVGFTNAVVGTITLLNEDRESLAEQRVSGEREVGIQINNASPGLYYVTMSVTDGASDYSIRQEQVSVRPPDPQEQRRQDLLAEANDLAHRDRYSAAIRLLEDALDADPDWAEGRARINQLEDEKDAFCARNPAVCAPGPTPIPTPTPIPEDLTLEEQQAEILSRVDDLVDNEQYEEAIALLESGLDVDSGWQAGSDRIAEIRALIERPAPPTDIRAAILQMQQQSGNQTLLRLQGCGSSSGLSVGDTGTIGDIEVEIIRITNESRCEGMAEASPGQIGAASHVEF